MPESLVPLQVSEADLFAQIGRLVVENQALRTLLAQAREVVEAQRAEVELLKVVKGKQDAPLPEES